MVATSLLFLLVTLAAGCANESAKWTFARAMNLAQEGQLDQAIALMERALEQSPSNTDIKLNLARVLAENGQGELGIGHCDELLESNPNDSSVLQVRSTCLQYLGRFDESLEAYKQCLSGKVERTPTERNNLAYFRALANTDLSMAANDIQSAIESYEGESWGCRYLVPIQVRTIVAAGLISRHINRQEEVLSTLNAKVRQFEQRLAMQAKLSQSRIYLEMQVRFPFDERVENELLFTRGNQEIRKNSLGLMLATRALLLEDLTRPAKADRDRVRLRELGFEFENLALELPSDEACLSALDRATYLLDTRGFVSGQREWKGGQFSRRPLGGFEYVSRGQSAQAAVDPPKPSTAMSKTDPQIPPSSYQEAQDDLTLAVLSARLSQLALESPLYNTPEISAQQMVMKKRLATRMTAVLLYHRMQVHLRGGNRCAADDDQRRIEQLGFQPDSSLF